jgi:leucyl aminopeptidase (aminopeptidase T)
MVMLTYQPIAISVSRGARPMHQNRIKALYGARLIITKCLHLSTAERFLLIYDETTLRFPRLFAQASKESRVRFEAFFVSRRLQASGEAFNHALWRSISRAHGILVATTHDPSCNKFRIVLTTDKRGARSAVATMPGASLSILSDAIDVDYLEVECMCRNLTLPLLRGKSCTILTFDPQGTKYTLTLKLHSKRIPIQSLGIIQGEAWGNVPAGETFVAPLETSAEGDYLVNGAIGSEKVTRRPALLQFSGGKLVKHFYLDDRKTVRYLDELAEVARSNGHAECWNTIAELGIGVNKALKTITGVQLVDEKKYGTIHIALGHNVGYGGDNNCSSVHCDITTQHPTLVVDGHRIIDKGEHSRDLSPFLEDYRTFSVPREFRWRRDYTHVHANEGSFQIEHGALNVVRRTASGRQTIFPPGNLDTAHAAAKLIAAIGKDNARPSELQDRLALSNAECDRLLSLLYMHGVIEHA